MSGQGPPPPRGAVPGAFGGPQIRPGFGQPPGQPVGGPPRPGGYAPPPGGFSNGPIPPSTRPAAPPPGAGPFAGPPARAPAGFTGSAPGIPVAGPPRGPPGPPGPGATAPFARGPAPGPQQGVAPTGAPGTPAAPPGQAPAVRGPPGPLSSPFPGSQLPGGPRPGPPGAGPPAAGIPTAYLQHTASGEGGSRPGTAPGSYPQAAAGIPGILGIPGQRPGSGVVGPRSGAPGAFQGGPPAAHGTPGFALPAQGPPFGAPAVHPHGAAQPPAAYPPQQLGPPYGAPPGSAQLPPGYPPVQAGPPSFGGAPPTFGGPPPPGGAPAGAPGPPTQMLGALSIDGTAGVPPHGVPPGVPPIPGAPVFSAGATQRGYPPVQGGMFTGLKPPPPPIGGQPPPPSLGGQPGMSRGTPAPFTGQPAGAAAPGSRIDPNQIPRPQPQASAGPLVFETRVNSAANIPPPATSQFIVRDTGNCSPRVMRPTLAHVPCSSDLLSTSGMPLALIIQPLGAPGPQDTQIQVVDFGEMGPVRCQRCKAYVNPFVRFVDQGRRFICNLCACANDTPRDYVCSLGPDGRRRDVDERPELMYGSVDFVAPKDYMIRDPMPPVYFFLVDVSLNAVSTGATASACSAIKQVLADISEDSTTFGGRVRVGLATFNSSIQFYSLNPSLAQPCILIVPEIVEPYTPLPSDLVVPLAQGRERLEGLLDQIPALYADTRVSDSCFGAAVAAGHLAIKDTGGRLVVFQSVLPSVGLGALAAREAEGRANSTTSDKEAMKLLQPLDKTLRTLASEFADAQVSVDVFMTCQGFCDLASIAVLPRFTGGQLYLYNPFSPQSDAAKLYNDLRWSVLRAQGLEAIMKVRCSNGLTVHEYSAGNFNHRIPAEIYLPAVDCDKAILVKLKLEDKLQDNAEACFQCAILYTTTTGQRRVRVHTMSVPTTASLASVFRGADLDSQVTYFLKKAAIEVLNHPAQTVRDSAITSCVNILHAYRKFCASASSSGQLILPEALKLLPLYTLALFKSLGLRSDAKLDERSYWLSRVRCIPASLAVPLVYPRLYPLHTAAGDHPQKEDSPLFHLPPSVALSSEKLSMDAVMLLESGEDAIIWVGKEVAPEVLASLFGVKGAYELVSGPYLLPQLDNPLSKRANDIVNEIRLLRSSYLRMRLVKRGDPQENLFLSQLIEDRSQAGMSYVEFLVYVHRQIQNKMA